MPILTILLSPPQSAARCDRIAATVARLTATILRKKPELTAVAIQHVDSAQWFIGGRSLIATQAGGELQQPTSFFLDVRVTEKTNSADEKARYITAVFAAMNEELGSLHETSYIHVHEVPADAWGYGGRTQHARALASAAPRHPGHA